MSAEFIRIELKSAKIKSNHKAILSKAQSVPKIIGICLHSPKNNNFSAHSWKHQCSLMYSLSLLIGVGCHIRIFRVSFWHWFPGNFAVNLPGVHFPMHKLPIIDNLNQTFCTPLYIFILKLGKLTNICCKNSMLCSALHFKKFPHWLSTTMIIWANIGKFLKSLSLIIL